MPDAEHPSWSELAKRPYPEHIYDSVRTGIAKGLIEKELRKQLPELGTDAQEALRCGIDHWTDGSRVGLAGIHDFWNGFDGITRGFKLKQFLPVLTGRNVSWERTEVAIASVTTTADLPVMESLEGPPYPIPDLLKALEDPKVRAAFKKDSDHHAEHPVRRDHYPVILMNDGTTKNTMDGNRRIIRAAVYDRPTIDAWVGTITDGNRPCDYWVTTGYLRNLVRFAEEQGNDAVTEATFTILRTLMSETEIAKTNYRLRIMKPGSFGEALGKRLGL